jgi:aspartate aminotransferase-like enzyme
MSAGFQGVMCDISQTLKQTYNAHSAVVGPGSGEAVARQFDGDQKRMVIRNGWLSYRWSQIFKAGSLPSESIVLKAQKAPSNVIPAHQAPFQPVPVDEVVSAIKKQRPAIVFVPHVETSAGMILPDDYLAAISEAVHSVGGLMVLDCIASGTI